MSQYFDLLDIRFLKIGNQENQDCMHQAMKFLIFIWLKKIKIARTFLSFSYLLRRKQKNGQLS